MQGVERCSSFLMDNYYLVYKNNVFLSYHQVKMGIENEHLSVNSRLSKNEMQKSWLATFQHLKYIELKVAEKVHLFRMIKALL